jgi:hypothetical protein
MAMHFVTSKLSRQSGNSLQPELTSEQRIRKVLLDRHWSMLVISIVVLVLSFVLSIRESRVACAGLDMPMLCGSQALFGIDCPGCGLTRSFVALADGNLVQSLEFHRVGWFIFLTVACQIPYRWYRLHELRSKVATPTWPSYFGYLLVALLVSNWLWNIWP